MMSSTDKISYHDLLPWNLEHRRFPIWGWFGLMVILVSQTLAGFQIEPVYTHFTLIVWWGYILLMDALTLKIRGCSFLATRPRFLAMCCLISLPSWLMFEFYNVYLENWVYLGLPENIVHRYIGYALAFATITPAILTTFVFVMSLWPLKRPEGAEDENPLPGYLLIVWFLCGLIFVTAPLLIEVREFRHFMFAFVWMGFVFLLEPFAYGSGSYSVLRIYASGMRGIVWRIFASGILCGLLWEYWNVWSGAMWLYTVPILPGVRYFEMPIVGMLGYLPFAWECLVIVVFVSLVWGDPKIVHPQVSSQWKPLVPWARSLLLVLASFWVMVISVHPERYFPVHFFSLTDMYGEENRSVLNENFMQTFLLHIEDYVNETGEWPLEEPHVVHEWAPNNATPKTLGVLRRMQRVPGFFANPPADFWLREYAVQSRFNWANLRNDTSASSNPQR